LRVAQSQCQRFDDTPVFGFHIQILQLEGII
jgi:hypothetical protein